MNVSDTTRQQQAENGQPCGLVCVNTGDHFLMRERKGRNTATYSLLDEREPRVLCDGFPEGLSPQVGISSTTGPDVDLFVTLGSPQRSRLTNRLHHAIWRK
mmetsp:Transcript_3687/g.8248  ORF Transcript_3687/g.8248 Transcript_3687/m.8248 type:complete len:101 (-) Transcript_3687:97-399(-)